MAQKSAPSFNPELAIQVCLGLFFLAAGIMGFTEHDSTLSGIKRLFGKKDDLAVIISVIEVIMAVLLFLGLALRMPGGSGALVGYALFLLWAAWLVYAYFAQDAFKPSFVDWFFRFSRDLVILGGLWVVAGRFAKS